MTTINGPAAVAYVGNCIYATVSTDDALAVSVYLRVLVERLPGSGVYTLAGERKRTLTGNMAGTRSVEVRIDELLRSELRAGAPSATGSSGVIQEGVALRYQLSYALGYADSLTLVSQAYMTVADYQPLSVGLAAATPYVLVWSEPDAEDAGVTLSLRTGTDEEVLSDHLTVQYETESSITTTYAHDEVRGPQGYKLQVYANPLAWVEEAVVRYALLGARSRDAYLMGDRGVPDARGWLSLYASTRRADLTRPYWVCGVPTTTVAAMDVTLHALYTDGHEETVTLPIGAVSAYAVVCVPCGVQQDWEGIYADAALSRVMVTATGITGSQVLTQEAQQEANYRALWWQNSIGGYDVLYCTGTGDERVLREFREAERIVPVEHEVSYGARFMDRAKTQATELLRSGYMDLDAYAAAEDVLRSEGLWLEDGALRPVVLRNGELVPGSPDSLLRSMELMIHMGYHERGTL